MDVVVIDSELWKQMNERLNKVEALLLQLVRKPVVANIKSKTDETIDDIDNWVLLKYALVKMKISKTTWYARGYNKKLRTSKRGKIVKVYLPSILKYIEEGAIN